MKPSASSVFDILESPGDFLCTKYVVRMLSITGLQKNVRGMIRILQEIEDDDASHNKAIQLASGLARLQLSPSHLEDAEIIDVLSNLNSPKQIEAQWGHDFHQFMDRANGYADALVNYTNPLREKALQIIRQCVADESSFRILCSRWLEEDFLLLIEEAGMEEPSQDLLLHTVVDYRKTKPFDLLIRVGPLRSGGMGRVPDAILNAPRFSRIAQITWYGAVDEEGIGMAPVGDWMSDQEGTGRLLKPHGIHWAVDVYEEEFGGGEEDEPGARDDDIDTQIEFELLSRKRGQVLVKAVLICITGEKGVFHRPGSSVLSMETDGNMAFVMREAGRLESGMFVIRKTRVKEMQLGEAVSVPVDYAPIWKERLRKKWQEDPEKLLAGIRAARINLKNPNIEHWCSRGSGVIYAPQRREYFVFLLRVLELEQEFGLNWILKAWEEISASRGEAITEGFVEHQIMDELLLEMLEGEAKEIRKKIESEPDITFFPVAIPLGKEVQGMLDFYRIRWVEGGYKVPDNLLERPMMAEEAEQWRE